MSPNSSSGEKKSKGGIIVLVVILLFVSTVVAVIALDIGGIRENHIMRYLRNAPLIGSMFTEAEEEDDDPLDSMSEDELRQLVRNYRLQVESLEGQRDERDKRIEDLNRRNTHLLTFERRWNEYRSAVASFVQMLAHNAPNEFVTYFESIVEHDLVPQDILAAAYAEAFAIDVNEAELDALVSTYNAMEEARAAENLSRMMTTNTTLAVRILRAMGPSKRAAIFDEMEPSVSTTFTILLSTEPPTFAPLVAPRDLPEILPPVDVPPVPSPSDEEEIEDEEEEIEDEE
jgi:flagellar motility protein MotE (MotC chaperone)